MEKISLNLPNDKLELWLREIDFMTTITDIFLLNYPLILLGSMQFLFLKG